MRKSVWAIRHVHFEGLGSLEGVLREQDFDIHYWDAGTANFKDFLATTPDLVVVLGGPISAYEESKYPFLVDEMRIIDARLKSPQPLLGICLGAQLMARVLGSRVYPGPAKELGWKPVTLTAAGREGSLATFARGQPVLHWHGDTFDLPMDTVRLASTDLVPNQAFAVGRKALALQFHTEARANEIERWLIGHACELAAASIDLEALRNDSIRFGPGLEACARQALVAWLTQAGLITPHSVSNPESGKPLN